MKLQLVKSSLAAVVATAVVTGSAFAADCESIGKKVTAAVKENPSKVLSIVDKMISKNESCACEIVKAAIETSKATKSEVREIVMTAVSAANGMAATIAECALAVAPEAAAEIRAGLSEVFEGAEEGDEEEEDVVVDESEDFNGVPPAVSGVYLIAPVTPARGTADDDLAAALAAAQRERARLLRELRRQRPDEPRIIVIPQTP